MHILCPHCRNPIELIRLDPREAVACPSCGSSFNVEPDATRVAAPLKSIGRFEVLETVGTGAFGTVYKARDPELQRLVAVKVPRSGNFVRLEDVDRFLREARSVAQLRHAAIVGIHEVGEAGELPYLVSEFVDGITLADLLTARRPSFRESAELLAQVADALHYAHERGIVHRDVKPSNIMLENVETRNQKQEIESEIRPSPDKRSAVSRLQFQDSNFAPRIMDFGLAKRDAGEITMTVEGQILGTPAYMSPEQAAGAGHQVDRRADVYSMGVILYELLTGEWPFRGNARMLLHQVLHDEPRAPRNLNDRIPRDLETICLKAMAKEPRQRYDSAAAFANDLRRYLRNEPIHARPVGRVEQLWRWSRRNPRVAILTSAVALLLAALAIGSSIAVPIIAAARDRAEQKAHDEQLARKDAHAAELRARAKQQEAETAEKKTTGALSAAQRNLYRSLIANAARAWQLNQVAECEENLDQCPTDERNWEWAYLKRQCHWSVASFKGHQQKIWSVALSPNGALAASGGSDRTVRIWDVDAGKLKWSLEGHSCEVMAVAFNSDGTMLASASLDHTIRLWDVAIGKEIAMLEGHGMGVSCLAFSPDDKWLATGCGDFNTMLGGEFLLWDVKKRKPSHAFKRLLAVGSCVAFSPDGDYLVTADYLGNVRMWEVESRKERWSLQSQGGSKAGFSKDGKRLVLANMLNHEITIHNARDGKRIQRVTRQSALVHTVGFSPDGAWIAASGGDPVIRFWTAEEGVESTSFRGHTDTVFCLGFSRDGKRLVSGGEDLTVKVWDMTQAQECRLFLRDSDRVDRIVFCPDGQALAVVDSDNETVRVWDRDGKQLLLESDGICCAWRADGMRLAVGCGNGDVALWDLETKEILNTLACHEHGLSSLDWSADGKYLATGGDDGSVRLWDAATGRELRTLRGHDGAVRSLIFNRDGTCLASGDENGMVFIWDPHANQPLFALKGHAGPVQELAFSPNGAQLVAAIGSDEEESILVKTKGELKVWDAHTGEFVRNLRGHQGGVYGVVFSNDGSRIATGGGDHTARIWDAATGHELLALRIPVELDPLAEARVLSVAWDPHWPRLLTGASNGDVRAWETADNVKAPRERRMDGH